MPLVGARTGYLREHIPSMIDDASVWGRRDRSLSLTNRPLRYRSEVTHTPAIDPRLIEQMAHVAVDQLDHVAGARPRFGALVRAGGEVERLVFRPVDVVACPDVFVARLAGSDRLPIVRPGDQILADRLLPTQAIHVRIRGQVADHPQTTRIAFLCPVCGSVSHHPTDLVEGYCGACHDWTGDR